jgi:hypothetical protein
MAETVPKKSGLRAFFGGRSNDSGSRKKLSKKGSQSEASQAGMLNSEFVANPRRQDSGSFTRPSVEQEAGLLTYEDVTSQGYRDSPYAAIASNRTYSQPSQDVAEYRRNSEGQQQYAAPLYHSSVSTHMRRYREVHRQRHHQQS